MVQPSAQRDELRRVFLEDAGLGDLHPEPLRQDASFRRYFRLSVNQQQWLLMDAPPASEHLDRWLHIAEHLRHLGLRAPQVFQADSANGFALIEDFGNNTFTRLLDAGTDHATLYRPAIDLLLYIHQHPDAQAIDLPPYDFDALINEAALLPDWFIPLVTGHPCPADTREEYLSAWHAIFSRLPVPAISLVLRDFHVDNLMQIPGPVPLEQIGLLDFQDAVSGPMAYDVLSLLEDARRDLPQSLRTDMLQHYRDEMPILDQENFSLWYDVLAAQRHCKVLGIFSRLALRDGKSQYLAHLKRVLDLLHQHLRAPALTPLENWIGRRIQSFTLDAYPDLEATRIGLGLDAA